MASGLTNQAIIDVMRSRLHGNSQKQALAPASGTPCSSDFAINDFAVTYPNRELIANVQVTGVPPGLTLLGVTVVATSDPTSSVTYCMGVASDSKGLALPVSVLAASTLPTFPGQTTVTGMVVLAYVRDGSSEEQCVITQEFTVGG